MLKSLLVSLALAFLFLSTPSYSNVANPPKCSGSATVSQFLATTSDFEGMKVFELSKPGVTKFISLVNLRRAQLSQEPYTVDRVMLGIFKGAQKIGVVMFHDDCVVLGTVATITTEDLDKFFKEAKVTQDDLIKVMEN